MLSCEQRTTERELTLGQLWEAGIWPRVLRNDCNPATSANQLRHSRQLLAEALHFGQHLLFLEDDIDVKRDFRSWVKLARWEDVPTLFCAITPAAEAHLNQPARRRVVPPTISPIAPYAAWVGAQALYLPHRTLAGLLDYSRGRTDSLDTVLREWSTTRGGEPVHIAHPNPVQHRNPPKVRAVHDKRDLSGRVSRSYRLTCSVPVEALVEARERRWRARTTPRT